MYTAVHVNAEFLIPAVYHQILRRKKKKYKNDKREQKFLLSGIEGV
jgi:hypothetical protein